MFVRSLLMVLLFAVIQVSSQSLQVSKNGRYLEKSDGTPFIWLGDTAWELFHKLDKAEATEYLENRAAKGFSVIQAVVLAENDGLRAPNPSGDVPFFDLDPTKPNEKYFQHVDFIVNKAEELGLFIGMLPTWGDKIWSLHPATGPIIFDKSNAEVYGYYLGKRYKEKPIIWILGGDRNVDSFEVLEIWRAMAKGIKEGDGGRNLMTFHPRGESSSSYWLHNEDWIDFNSFQSGHARKFNYVYRFLEHDRLLNPTKPTLDSEPAYEDIAIKFWEFCDWNNPMRVPTEVLNEDNLINDVSYFKNGFINDHDVRIHAYWNFLAGACGYTYGNNAIWQMFKKGGPIAIPALYDWRESMDRPGAFDIQNIRSLFEKYSLNNLVPDQSFIYGPNPDGEKHLQAAGSKDNSFALIYFAVGQSVNVVMGKIKGEEVAVTWFNTRDGSYSKSISIKNEGIVEFITPSIGKEEDWLLILESR